MKKIITIFAIFAFANCSTFLRNLADTTTCTATSLEEAAASEALCKACDGSYTAEKTEEPKADAKCECPAGEQLKSKVGCRRDCTTTSAIASANTAGYCKGCNGVWDDSAATKCSCATGTKFKENVGCEAVECNVEDADTMKKADKDVCAACGLSYDDTKTDSKCSCPTDGTSIKGETLCKFCNKEWKDSKCSGFSLKIASALFAILFLL